MSDNTTSAFLGREPNTLDDYYIIKGIYRASGLHNYNATKGWTTSPSAPAGYVHETEQPAIIAGMVIVMLVITCTTGTRLVLRARSKSVAFGSDDWTIWLAATLAVVYTIFQIIRVVQGGAGKHSWEVTYAEYEMYASYGRLCQILYYVIVGLIKVSIALFLRRLVKNAARVWSVTADVYLALAVAYVLAAVFWGTLVCDPPRASWDKRYAGAIEHPASCPTLKTSTRTLRLAHLVLGVMLLTTPIIVLWQVRIGWGVKARLFLVWAAGALTVIGGLLQQFSDITADLTWSYTRILVWCCVDICMGMITASLPVMDGWLFGSWKLGSSWKKSAGSRGGTARPGAVLPTIGSKSCESGSTKSIMRTDSEVDMMSVSGSDSTV